MSSIFSLLVHITDLNTYAFFVVRVLSYVSPNLHEADSDLIPYGTFLGTPSVPVTVRRKKLLATVEASPNGIETLDNYCPGSSPSSWDSVCQDCPKTDTRLT
jgi:hypothetical protein